MRRKHSIVIYWFYFFFIFHNTGFPRHCYILITIIVSLLLCRSCHRYPFKTLCCFPGRLFYCMPVSSILNMEFVLFMRWLSCKDLLSDSKNYFTSDLLSAWDLAKKTPSDFISVTSGFLRENYWSQTYPDFLEFLWNLWCVFNSPTTR